MTEFQQRIYNTWLRVTRTSQNKPFRLRKNFTSLNESTNTALLKLESFFLRNKTIAMDDFFVAPFKLYDDTSNMPLSFYTTLKAIKVYKNFKKYIENQNH
jgi:hypothetical protein